MNSLVLTFDCKKPFETAKAILNGEDVSNKTRMVSWEPDGLFIELFREPTLVDGKLNTERIKIDEFKFEN